MRGCAIFGPDGELIASTGDRGDWADPGRVFIGAVDATPVAGGKATHGHVATAQGEVFVVSEDGFHAVAVFDRFCLASLVFFDLRAAIRDIRGEEDVVGAGVRETGG